MCFFLIVTYFQLVSLLAELSDPLLWRCDCGGRISVWSRFASRATPGRWDCSADTSLLTPREEPGLSQGTGVTTQPLPSLALPLITQDVTGQRDIVLFCGWETRLNSRNSLPKKTQHRQRLNSGFLALFLLPLTQAHLSLLVSGPLFRVCRGEL